MTVAQLREVMGNAEYTAWVAWHALRAQEQDIAAKGAGR